jgi:hypothetical protein
MTGSDVYKGRNLRVRRVRGGFGRLAVTVNGETWTTTGSDVEKELDLLRSRIDFIDRDPAVDGDRWDACWYAPGTYRMCDEGLHPVALDGECRHFTCVEKRGEMA